MAGIPGKQHPKSNYPLKTLSPINPLRRIRKQLGLTQESLADLADVTRTFVVRHEQAVYESPSESLYRVLRKQGRKLNRISREHESIPSFEAVEWQYAEFQRLTRLAHRDRLDHEFFKDPLTLNAGLGVHPFVLWREFSGIDSRIAISKFFCVQPATVTKYERNPNLCAETPPSLLSALEGAGLPVGVLDQLEAAFQEYKTYLKSRVRVTYKK